MISGKSCALAILSMLAVDTALAASNVRRAPDASGPSLNEVELCVSGE